MSVIRKLNTLFRAGSREMAEVLLDANSLRIYEQEIVDAEYQLATDRDAMAMQIANREELAKEIALIEARIRSIEARIASLPEQPGNDSLLELAASEISDEEVRLQKIQREKTAVCEQISQQEMRLRKLMSDIKQHRRDLKLMRAQLHTTSVGPALPSATLAARMQSLRNTGDGIRQKVKHCVELEASVDEVGCRLDVDPLQQQLDSAEQKLHRAATLARLKSIRGPVARANTGE